MYFSALSHIRRHVSSKWVKQTVHIYSMFLLNQMCACACAWYNSMSRNSSYAERKAFTTENGHWFSSFVNRFKITITRNYDLQTK